ncbi:MAG: bifunctional 5,10-methylene-tetrahydrofolate dehydrogenase/5,10-methylene-tetrahydrofolate cyclohydrolase, partial [Clostridia bacterium]|nr:bifunctional 5,10-methylene-tetrahydrofolate dehydrogenase/5,10-methylene-tetrahydrofolate cyclohydrolase [Clostridia bacterium]
MSKILLGKEVAFDMTLKIRSEVNELRLKGIVPTIALVRLGEKDADLSYEKSIIGSAKECGIDVFSLPLPEDSTADDLFQVLYGLNQNENVHGVLLFRPLPEHLKEYEEDLISILDSEKDIDCMTLASNESFYNNIDNTFAPCTAEAVIAMLKYYNI